MLKKTLVTVLPTEYVNYFIMRSFTDFFLNRDTGFFREVQIGCLSIIWINFKSQRHRDMAKVLSLRPVHVGLFVSKLALGQICLPVQRIPRLTTLRTYDGFQLPPCPEIEAVASQLRHLSDLTLPLASASTTSTAHTPTYDTSHLRRFSIATMPRIWGACFAVTTP
jgi:hypothetical protein